MLCVVFFRVCYERCPVNPTAATFLLSAMWHGVYPGYYLTFVTGIAVTMAARAVSALLLSRKLESFVVTEVDDHVNTASATTT